MSFVRNAVVCISIAAATLLPLAPFDGAGAAIVPPQTPSSNIFPEPNYSGPCGSVAAPNAITATPSGYGSNFQLVRSVRVTLGPRSQSALPISSAPAIHLDLAMRSDPGGPPTL